MAIEFDCPHCQTHYKLRDELAGKRATCKNPDCRKVLTVPAASANGTHPPELATAAPADVEAAALSALADAPVEQAAAAPKDIPLQCPMCETKWTEPASKAGKNVLCPECRHRIKVPEPKQEVPDDWRRQNSKLPSLAKENVRPELEGVQASTSAGMVGGDALKKAGVLDDEVEPRPLKQKILFAVLALGLIAGVVAGVMFYSKSRTAGKKDQLMELALKEYTDAPEDARPPGPEDPLFAALLHTAAGEYAARQPDKAKLVAAAGHFDTAAAQLRESAQRDPKGTAAAGRFAVAAELAVAVLALGGTEEQVKKELKYSWLPPDTGDRQLRAFEKNLSVHRKLTEVLGLAKSADPDTKAALARRLTRELVKRGQAELAAYLPAMMFTDPEQPEAKALVAIELWRQKKDDPLPRATAEELQQGPQTPTVQTLLKLLDGTPAAADKTESGAILAAGLAALRDDPKAVALAQAAPRPDGRLRALLAVAEWAADPGPALDAAAPLAAAGGKTPAGGAAVALPPAVLFRLSQIAAAAGKDDRAKAFADAIPDDGLKAWARGDLLRVKPADEAAADAPDDPKKVRVGNAWGRLWVARHAAKSSGDGDPKKVAGWPAVTIKPFGLAGMALGLQDRE